MRPSLMVFFSALATGLLLAAPLNITIEGYNVQDLISVFWGEGINSAFLPGYPYRSNFMVSWSIPDSALQGIDSDKVEIFITASAPENSTLQFEGSNTKEISFTLACIVYEGECAANSSLSRQIEFTFVPSQNQPNTSELISINASLYAPAEHGLEPQGILRSLAEAASNYSGLLTNSTSLDAYANTTGSLLQQPQNQSAHTPSAPSSFLLENPLLSLAAFALVILVTGAYLLKNKD